MPASKIFGAIQQGMARADERVRQQEQDKFNKQQRFLQLDQQRMGNMFSKGRIVNTLLKAGQIGEANSVLDDNIQLINQLNGDPSDSLEIKGMVGAGDIQGATDLLDSVEMAGVQSGFLKDMKPSELSQINLEKARIELENLKRPPQIDPEFLKEERKVARDTVKDFNKRSSEIRSSYGKVESILSSGKLNRMKIASAMTSMARLLSPGIVTNQDFQNLSNSANPVAELLSKLTGKGEQGANVAENLQRFYDPTNPDLFDKKAFLSTARNVAGAEIPSLIQSFAMGQERAKTAGLSERAIETNFSGNKNLAELQGLLEASKPVIVHKVLGEVTEEQISKAMKEEGLTRDQVLAILEKNN